MTRKKPITRIAIRKTPLPMEQLAKQGTDTRTHNELRGELWRMYPGLGTATQDALGARVVLSTLESIAEKPEHNHKALGAFAAELATTLGVTGRILLEHTKWRNQPPGSKTRDMYGSVEPVAWIAPGEEVPELISSASAHLSNAIVHADGVVASFVTPGRRALRHSHRQALGESLLSSAIALAPLAAVETLRYEGNPVVRSELAVSSFDDIDCTLTRNSNSMLPSLIQLGREEGHTLAETRLFNIPDAGNLVASFMTARANTSFDMFDPRETAFAA